MRRSDQSRSFKVGVQLPEVERFVPWPELISMAKTAEAVGFDSIWLGDHLLYDLPDGSVRGPWEVWTSLAAIAAVTTRVEIGPLVASIGFHEPAMLAKQAATVDAISGGRLIVGLGAGWNEREYRAFGFAYDQRVSRFEEAFGIIRRLLVGEVVDFSGRFYNVARSQVDPISRPGGPPLLLGSTAPRMMSIALPHVQSWNVWWSRFGNTVEGFASEAARVEEQCQIAGRAPGAVQATAAVYVQVPGGGGRTMGSDKVVAEPLRGTQRELADQLAAFGAAGCDHLQLVVDPITQASIEWLGGVLELL